MYNKIQLALTNAVQTKLNLSKDITFIRLEKPSDIKHGDWSSNVALLLSKEIGKNPREIATEIQEQLMLNQELMANLTKVEVAGPGFINFYIAPHFFVEELKTGIQTNVSNYAGKKVMVEFTDPNPFKELHVGHLYSNTVGESICRIFEAAGAIVKRADYFGDVGMHVAKSLWGLIKKLEEDGISIADLEARSIKERIKYLGQSYALGAFKFKENDEAKAEMRGINKQIFIVAQQFYRDRYNTDPHVDYSVVEAESPFPQEQIADYYLKGRSWSLDYFDSIYERLGMKYDYYYPESVVAEDGYMLVQKGLESGIFTKSEGAIVLDGEKSGLHTRVFVNSMGLPTYEAKELGLAPTKLQDFEYDLSIIITGDEIDEYFKVLLKAMEMLIPEIREKTEHYSHGMVRLPEGKMSSRTGKIIRAEDVLDMVKEVILKSNPNLEAEPERAEKIAQAALKFAFLKSRVEGNIEFDMQKSVSVEGDTGPYLQYSYVRATSILEKLHVQQVDKNSLPTNISLDDAELSLLRALSSFPQKLAAAADSRQPYILAAALLDVAREFNSFYGNHNVKSAKGERKDLWLALTKEVAQVLKRGLWILGIEVVEEM